MRVLVCHAAAVLLGLPSILPAQTSPAIEIISLPAFGSASQTLSGRIATNNPASYRVAVLIFVPGLGYYSKPTCASTTVSLDAQGRFNALLTTGGIDHLATLISVLVVPASLTVPCVLAALGVPENLENASAARLTIPRPNPNQREIQFSGETWVVKSSPVAVGPGLNYFSDSVDNVFVDTVGRLHLRITKRNNIWYCAELVSKRRAGYGQYSVTIESPPIFDPSIVFGAFTWTDGDRNMPEIDLLEIGKFGRSVADPTNAQNVVQPFGVTGNLNRITLPNVAPLIHTMNYAANQLLFRTSDSGGATVSQWQYAGRPPQPGLDPHFRLNFWLFGGAPPTDSNEAEIIISSVTFPLAPEQRLISVIPTTGAGPTQTFTGIFRHPGGSASHYLGYMLFLPTPNIVWFTATGSCLVEYNRISSSFRLINDAGNDWLSTPTAGKLSNSQCSVNVTEARATLSGEDMIVTAPVTFQTSAMTLVLGTFLQELDVTGAWTDMRQFGNWVLPGAPVRPGPALVSMGATSHTGGPVTYVVTASHSSGVSALGLIHLLVSDAIVGRPPCQVVYFATTNSLNLINESGTALVSATNVPLGTAQVLSNGRCSVNVGQALRSQQGTTLTYMLPMTFDASAFGGHKSVYVNVFDVLGNLSHWVQAGTLDVQ